MTVIRFNIFSQPVTCSRGGFLRQTSICINLQPGLATSEPDTCSRPVTSNSSMHLCSFGLGWTDFFFLPHLSPVIRLWQLRARWKKKKKKKSAPGYLVIKASVNPPYCCYPDVRCVCRSSRCAQASGALRSFTQTIQTMIQTATVCTSKLFVHLCFLSLACGVVSARRTFSPNTASCVVPAGRARLSGECRIDMWTANPLQQN